MAQNLAPIYVDNDRVRLQGDPRPTVQKILDAGGKQRTNVRIVRLNSKEEQDGETLNPTDVIDRTQQASQEVYLRILEEGRGRQSGGGTGQVKETQFGGSQASSEAGQEWTGGGSGAAGGKPSAPGETGSETSKNNPKGKGKNP